MEDRRIYPFPYRGCCAGDRFYNVCAGNDWKIHSTSIPWRWNASASRTSSADFRTPRVARQIQDPFAQTLVCTHRRNAATTYGVVAGWEGKAGNALSIILLTLVIGGGKVSLGIAVLDSRDRDFVIVVRSMTSRIFSHRYLQQIASDCMATTELPCILLPTLLPLSMIALCVDYRQQI